MGSTQSTHTTSEIKEPSFKEVPNCSVSGRKQSTEIVQTERTMISPDGEADVSVTSSEDYYSSDEESEEEEDEEWNERLQILQDAKNLRKLAVDYLHPEKSVVTTDPCATARNYFTRASAEEYEDEDTMDERDDILADMKSLKIQAETYLMPEKPVEVDPLATCRNYFDRASAPDTESAEEAAERAQVLADAQMLKTFAVHYMHPEKPVVCDDAYATGRNYFSRASAPQFDDSEEAEERAQVLADAAQLKQLAVDYLHPELPVVTSDGAAMGRNYFTRASAEEYEDEDTMDDRDDILADMQALKAQAETYLMPEKPLEVDPLATCRNYFDRASAPESESAEEANERAQILADAQALKKLAVDYLHPEKPVVCDDASATGRNYFSRASAPQFDDSEEAEERAQVLADAAQLKQLAVDYLHPELPVVTSDGAAMGRNYFTRASAEEYEDEDTMDDRDDILADMQALKAQAETYLMPEKPLEVDPLATCRNYFDRASAPESESAEEAAERAQVLADAQMLKKLAVDYLHPEKPVVCDDACATGRNYFSRASAPQFDDLDEAEERAQVLADAAQLKKLAVDYMHPEKPVVTSDGAAMGRNYFSRASAEEFEDAEEAEERAQALADAAQLKKLAVDYLHPELPVVTSDPCATGRNYFSRASAEEYEDEDTMDEREDILADMQALKAQAETYLMPEKPLEVDPLATCRNYFDRASAPDTESAEEAAERAQVLADAQLLKKLAVDYLHPEKPVVCDDACATGRNYFSRASAPQFDDLDEAEERAQVLADAAQLKKLAVDYMHPEKPVVTSDGAAMGRNYFSRASAEEFEDAEEAEERAQALADAAQLKKLAVDYLHPEKPVVCDDACATGRNYFSRASAEEYEDEDTMDDRDDILADMQALKAQAETYLMPERPVEVDPLATCRNYFDRASAPESESAEEANERAQILADAQALKKLAVDYLHPEKPVVCDDACATGRNYFSRASAPQFDDSEEAEERAQVLADAAQLKKLAVDYMHPEKPVVTSDGAAMGRNYFSRASAEEFEDAEEAEERAQALADAAQLKKLAVDYLHPEKPVVTSDGSAMGRNYFSRASAEEYDDADLSNERATALADAQQLKKLATDYLCPGPVEVDPLATARCYFDRPSGQGHADHIHSQGHSLSHGYTDSLYIESDDHHANYYHSHHHDDHCSQSDHFEMDEDAMYNDIRESLHLPEPFKGEHPKEVEEEGEEGKLSRSPSCVMLFDEGVAM